MVHHTTMEKNVQHLCISQHEKKLTFILLMWTFGRAPNNASKWQMGFNSEEIKK